MSAAGAQSPTREHADPLVGESAPGAGAPAQQTDAQQRPGVSGAEAPKTAGEDASGVSPSAIKSSAGAFTSQEERKKVETQ
ncbi:hypothetical protein Q5752_003770 [Cryptotrichosporon argae]